MKKDTKVLLIFAVLLMNTISCQGEGKGNEKNQKSKNMENIQKVESKTEEIKINVEEMYGKGIDEEFTTDGKLHEEKFLNKVFGYPDTEDSFKIEKDDKGYFVTDYISEPEEDKNKDGATGEEKSRLKLYKDVYLVNEEGTVVYAYDTRLQKMVFINSDFRIFMITDELND